jgi:hypothetical protein
MGPKEEDEGMLVRAGGQYGQFVKIYSYKFTLKFTNLAF